MSRRLIILSVLFLITKSSIAESWEKGQWVSLFLNDSFDLWSKRDKSPVSKGWHIKDKVVHLESKGGSIITKNKYFNFELIFEWKISKGGNSGVKYRSGMEYQILDDESTKALKYSLTSFSASIYDLIPAKASKKYNSAGEWNFGRVYSVGNKIEHWLNGNLVAEITLNSKDWDERYKNSKYSRNGSFGKKPSSILIQSHGGNASFKNVKIREYTKQKKSESIDQLKLLDFNNYFSEGEKLYNAAGSCVACHLKNGEGHPNAIPPLKGSGWLRDDHSRERLIALTLRGLEGPIVVNGKKFDSAMPPQIMFSNDQLAKILTFVLSNWGKNKEIISSDMIKKARTKYKGPPYSAKKLIEKFPFDNFYKIENGYFKNSDKNLNLSEITKPFVIRTFMPWASPACFCCSITRRTVLLLGCRRMSFKIYLEKRRFYY